MTSLQKQLAAIAATTTHELDLKAQSSLHSQSLIFDPKVAVSQSFDTLFQICIEGFEELCSLDSRYRAFQKTLFSPQSKQEDRARMTEKENYELDRVIEKFLALVTSRISLNPAIKAVEWLVRRFRIHEYNVSVTILTFLPYHTTHIFPTLLSILPSQLPIAFKFLHSYKQQLSRPPHEAIVRSASTNNDFFLTLNRHVVNVCKLSYHNHNLMAFWAPIAVQSVDARLDSTMTGRLNVQTQRQEELLNMILPVLNEGFAFKAIPEMQLGCYMIVTVLIQRTSLNKQIADALAVAIASNWTPDTFEAGLSCLAIMLDAQEKPSLPRSSARAIINNPASLEIISRLQKEQSVERLVMATAAVALSRLGRGDNEKSLTFLETVLNQSFLPRSASNDLLESVRHLVLDTNNVKDLGSRPRLHRLLVQQRQDSHTETEEPGSESDSETCKSILQQPDRDSDFLDNLNSTISAIDMNSAIKQGSFFSEQSNDPFLELTNLILPALEGSMDPDLILSSIPIFEQQTTLETGLLLSFLVRAWCSQNLYPSQVRRKLIRACANHITRNDLAPSVIKDLIPYCLIALSDHTLKVRREASQLLRELKARLKTASSAESKSNGFFSLFASKPKKQETLSDDDMLSFVSTCLAPNLSECIADATHLKHLLYLALDVGLKSNATSQKLKSDQKLHLFKFFASHAIEQPFPEVQIQLVELLNTVDHFRGKSRSSLMFPCLHSWVTTKREIMRERLSGASPDSTLLAKMDTAYFDIAQSDDSTAISFLEDLATTTSADNEDVSVAALRRIQQIWTRLEEFRQRTIAASLLDIIVGSSSSSSSQRQAEATKPIRMISKQESSICNMVDNIVSEIEESDSPHTRKKRRIENGTTSRKALEDEHDKTMPLSKLTLLLDYVDSAKKGPSMRLFNTIFRTLTAIHSRALHTSADLGYLENLTLRIMSDILVAFQASHVTPKVDDSAVRIDVVVDCIRNTSSSQTRNSALLLLAKLVHYVPQNALHNLIPIFTFISSATARHNDEFAAHVVDQTMREVIPVLSKALQKRNQNLAEATSEIVLSFAAAFDHIPEPRKLPLFTLLGTTIGPSESLFAIIAALVDRNTADNGIGDFAGDLLRQFDTPIIIRTCVKYLELVLDSLEPKPHLFKIYVRSAVDTPSSLTAVSTLTDALAQALSNAHLSNKIRKAASKQKEGDAHFNIDFGIFIESSIKLIKSTKSEPLRNSLTILLERMLEIVPFERLTQTVAGLLERTSPEVHIGILRSLEKQVRRLRNPPSSIAQAATDFLERLSAMLTSATNEMLRCNIVSCIDQICEKFGATNIAATFNAATTLTSAISRSEESILFQSLSLHCLASTVEVLQNEFVPLLTESLNASVACVWQSTKRSTTEYERLHNAACSLFISALEHLSYMITKQSVKEIMESLQHSTQSSHGVSAKENSHQVLQLVATRLELKMTTTCAIATWPTALQAGPKSLSQQIELLRVSVEHHPKAEVTRNANTILDGFLTVLDIRQASANVDISEEQLSSLEQQIINGLIALTLKINDLLFRPFFTRLIEWVTQGTSSSSAQSAMGPRARTFFGFLHALSERLKSIVTSYFDAPLDLSAAILRSSYDKSSLSRSLQVKRTVLTALLSAFSHDQDDFFAAPHRFSRIIDPLLDQLTLHASQMQYLTTSAIPTIAAFATAVSGSPDHLKALNSTFLKLLKSDSAKVRLAALKTEMELTRRLGEDWLALLPEMLPVISELQEDGDEGVERDTIRWVKMIEETLGESLDAMLT